MIERIKNFLLKKMVIFSCFRVKKFWLGVFLFFVIFSLILPSLISAQFAVSGITKEEEPGEASCNWWNPGTWTDCIKIATVKVVGIVIFAIPLAVSHFAFMMTGLILGWVISPDFISFQFTNNPFVNLGLSLTRDLANMGFLIFLIVIALATALRIQEYKARKTLPILIIIGLLVNFSPVFCGVIIDASNIVMHRFTADITGLKALTSGFDQLVKNMNALIWEGWDTLSNAISGFFYALAAIIFFIFAAFVFILFSLLFAVRYVMLWILVILSPIAFVSYILPMTRRGRSLLNWRTWWTQFVQWCIIGIVAAFFLYLGLKMITLMEAQELTINTGGEGWDKKLGMLDRILPWLVPLILLYIGYKELKKTTAMFARGIISGTEKVVKTVVGASIQAATIAATAGIGAAAGAATTAAGTASTAAKGAGLATKVKAGALRAGAWTLRRGAGAARATSGAFGAKPEPFTWERRPPSEEEEVAVEEERVTAVRAPAKKAPKKKAPETGEEGLRRKGAPEVGEPAKAEVREEVTGLAREAERKGIVEKVGEPKVEEKEEKPKPSWKTRQYRRLKELVESRPEDYIKEIEPPELGAGKKEWAKWGLRQSFESIGKATAKAIVDAAQEGLKAGFEQTIKEAKKPFITVKPEKKKRKLKREYKRRIAEGEDIDLDEPDIYEGGEEE